MTCATEEVLAAAGDPLVEAMCAAPSAGLDLPSIVPVARRLGATRRWSVCCRAGASVGASLAGHVGVLAWLALAPAAIATHWLPVRPGKASIELKASLASQPAERPVDEVEIAPPCPEPLRSETPPDIREPRLPADAPSEPAVPRRLPKLPARATRREPVPLQPAGIELAQAVFEVRRAETPMVDAAVAMRVPKASPQSELLLEASAQASAASMPSDASRASEGAAGAVPSPVYNPAPQYPPEALAARQTGRVVLRVEVGPDGTVLSVEVHGTSGIAALDEAAREAVRRWRFSPAPGHPVREVAVPVRFTIAGHVTSGG